MTKETWESGGDVDSMPDETANCIRETVREVLGVSRGRSRKHQWDWWWNEEVKEKVEAKKRVCAKLVESKDEEDKRKNREEYKISKREANKSGDKRLYRLAKVRERRDRYLDQVKCIKDVDDKVLVEEGCIRKRWQAYFHKLLSEGRDTSIVLGDLEYSQRFRCYGYCRRIKVEEVNRAIRTMH
ncbi:uncharacterized protein LOC124889721 [Capsicum annuum]|uniref:uncharacterized protein LOC124889721 n=1 Tax=Capsicum annuum TaxID=4072 RepID=UPI001FB15D06|nr:uncharacterized protein LOC124889721 [Capsicum annuum]